MTGTKNILRNLYMTKIATTPVLHKSFGMIPVLKTLEYSAIKENIWYVSRKRRHITGRLYFLSQDLICFISKVVSIDRLFSWLTLLHRRRPGQLYNVVHYF